ncbi:hypothetical protein [Lactobacillus agrestimuris]|uniref:hypothetical protein n=1 Tax=Lactobacillus agrestimuris TaxID=2941328 RepID=UPI0020439FC2|nr:hypothetical protein [Lactobacillus agrestimuris]
MVESAYSEELKKEIEAKEANKLSKNGTLNSEYKFHCLDPNCAIPLTCTNWKKTGKRYYFKPSSNSELHIDGCNQISSTELNYQNKKDFKESKSTVIKGGMIIVDRYPSKAKSQNLVNGKKSLNQSKRTTKSNNIGKSTQGSKTQNSHRSALYSLIELWKDEDIPNDRAFLKIDGNLMKLNELFVKVADLDTIPINVNLNLPHIFYGNARVTHSDNGPICFNFFDFSQSTLYANYNQLKKRAVTKDIDNYINTGNIPCVYFRGYYDNDKRKFKPFNNKFYQDIYLE